MNPENRDRLLRVGEVLPSALANPSDFNEIADLCTEEFALELFARTARGHQLLTGREQVTCAGHAMFKADLIRCSQFLNLFLQRRMNVSARGVALKDPVRPVSRTVTDPHWYRTSELPDLIEGEFTTLAWRPGTPHCERFPHLILLVAEKNPRVYTVLPMDPVYLGREDWASEVARIFSLYGQVDVCLVLGRESCIYFRKDGTSNRSRHRPTGGAVAHRRLTGPHLFRHYAEPLEAAFKDEPCLFAWEDEFDGRLNLLTNEDSAPVKTVTLLKPRVFRKVTSELQSVRVHYEPLLSRQWDGNRQVLKRRVCAWLKALELPGNVRIIGRKDLLAFSSRPLVPSEWLQSPLHRVLDGALDVMEVDLMQAGLYEIVNKLLQPLYTTSHVSYLRLLAQSERLSGIPDNETLWKRIQGQVLPAAFCSPITLARLEAWRQVQPLYRECVQPMDTPNGSYAEAQRVLAALPLLRRVNDLGPMWMWQAGDAVQIMPAVVVRLDDKGEYHCENGPAAIDPDGTEYFAIHGDEP